MRNNLSRTLKMVPGVVALALLSATFPAMTDDTEIYQAEYDSAIDGGTRAKVLIVFDDSGSMGTDVVGQRPDYDPAATYVSSVTADRIYWSTDGTVPSSSSSRWFTGSSNRCDSSYDSLDNDGRFTTERARRWVDSTVQAGQCTDVCPAGQTLRNPPGPNNRGCYSETLVQDPVTKLVYYSNDSGNSCSGGRIYVDPEGSDNDACYVEVESSDPIEGWVYRRNDRDDDCRGGLTYLYVDPPGGGNAYDACFEEVTEPVFDEYTDWTWEGHVQQSCDPDTDVPGSWQSLDRDANSPTHVECRDDVTNSIDSNGPSQGPGYPQDNVLNGSEYGPDADGTIDWGNTPYTFFTSHYMDWYYDSTLVVTRTRLEIAQEVISTIVRTNTSIDFGLVEFNGSQGGRVVQRIIEDMDDDDRENLIDLLEATDHAGVTPMCESMYEAYNYIAGRPVEYGNLPSTGTASDGDTYDGNPKDLLAESSGTYISPNTDCAYTYIILMTDGYPYFDTDANSKIQTLTGKTCDNYLNNDFALEENCLPQLTEYMANTDLDGNADNGNQYGITYTIGFATDQVLLNDAADNGKGEYYTATNADELTAAFQGAIVGILSSTTTFTSPAVAVDTFTRTQSRDEVFYAMFKPESTIDWIGNIKKLKLDSNAVLVDKNGDPALDPASGAIKDSATTFWSASADGSAVEQGGVGALLAARDPGTRTLYSNTGASNALEAFNKLNFTYDALGLAAATDLYALLGTSTEAAAFDQIAWAQGFDAYDADGDTNKAEARDWIVGDILHSQPLVINYGALGSATVADPDLRLLVGSNSGWVHFFGNSDGVEDWAFFPKELAGILPQRRRNAVSNDHVYGMDLTPTAYIYDGNFDGTIDASAGDKVYAYLGMRRGGKSIYALNLSNPNTPVNMWRVGKDTVGFGEMGQTWSEPVVAKIPGYKDVNGAYKPVLIFAAGYDTSKDASGVGTADAEGRGIFIVDAQTGALIWSVTPAANSVTNLSEPGLIHSVPGGVSILDSNADEIVDRVYFGDTGGNLWRVDLVGDTLPTSSQDTWQINKLAAVNGGSIATDRRIFNAPDIVRIRVAGQAVDGVIFGTGDRTNPNATDVDNRVYMIRDEVTAPYTTDKPTSSECSDPDFEDFRCNLPITDADLFDITSNVLNDGTEAEIAVAALDFYNANGWRYELGYEGEKSLAKTVTINGRAFVPTFTPANVLDDIDNCVPSSGSGLMYVFDIYTGERGVINLGSIIPDTPSLHFASDGTIRFLLPPGAPASNLGEPGLVDCVGAVCDLNESLRPPYGNYWFQEGYE
ncbi:MAG: PilC/PilY family type IV pilus protein [Pseudomonadota bacterium]